MRKTESEVKNTLSQYQDDFLMFWKVQYKVTENCDRHFEFTA